jgi:hypothetical protein
VNSDLAHNRRVLRDSVRASLTWLMLQVMPLVICASFEGSVLSRFSRRAEKSRPRVPATQPARLAVVTRGRY